MVELNIQRLHSELILHEGLRLLPYDDTTGMPIPPGKSYRGKLTIGVGRNLDGNPLTRAEETFIGHNCREKAITQDQAIYLLDHDIASVCKALDNNIGWWQHLEEIRARVLVDMCFNMGINKLIQFRNMLSAARTGNYNAAADGMKASLWYDQVGARGKRLEAMMRTGEDWIS